MPKPDDPTRQRAERLFRTRQEEKATAEYHAEQERLRDRTKELRQLRLAREAKTQSDGLVERI